MPATLPPQNVHQMIVSFFKEIHGGRASLRYCYGDHLIEKKRERVRSHGFRMDDFVYWGALGRIHEPIIIKDKPTIQEFRFCFIEESENFVDVIVMMEFCLKRFIHHDACIYEITPVFIRESRSAVITS